MPSAVAHPLVLLNSSNCSLVSTTVDFAANKTEACLQETIVFSDSTKGAGTAWAWDFGSGANPASANGTGPHSVQYITGGKKTVKLTVSTVNGPVDSIKTDYLEINTDPRVNAKAIVSHFGINYFRFYSENGSNYTNEWLYNNDNDTITGDTVYFNFHNTRELYH